MQILDVAAQYDDIEGIVRPQQNPNLFGHADIIAFLSKMRAQNHLASALLFEGPRGVGKASLAFHFALAMLSDHPHDHLGSIDEDCAVWRQIARGSHPALMHVSRPFDAKTEKFRTAITVEEMRKVNHFMHQSQPDNGWRIVIIDPADDMNRNSANALLKILEEPPRRALFILISHHKGRLLPTIRSRCQTLHFKPLGVQDLTRALEVIAPPIGFGRNPQQDAELVQKAQGSVRQALLLLQFGGLEIARALDDFLDMASFNPGAANNLATILSGREAQVQFDYFIDYLLHQLGSRAHQCALAGDLLAAEQLAILYECLSGEISEALAYNLDRKHFIAVLLTKLYQQLNRF